MANDEGQGGAARVVVFLFTDIEGSTRQWERAPAVMRTALARHDGLVREAIVRHGGHVFKTVGDAFCAAFGDPGRALGAAVDVQRELHAEAWPDPIRIRVRIALHAGPAEERDGDFFGPHVNRVARLLTVASGGQVVLSRPFVELVRGALLGDVELADVGSVPLKDIAEPEHVYGLVVPGLAEAASYARAPDAPRHNLPALRTPIIGRERELAAVEALLLRDDVGLVTLSGPAGTGKTRLSMAVAAALADRFEDGARFVALAPIRDPDLVVSAIVRTLGLQETGGMTLEATLESYLRDRELLLVLDNFEQVTDAAPLIGRLLASCPYLKVLVSSRVLLNLYGEQDVPVPPLGLPRADAPPPVDQLSDYPAIALFVQRARAIRPDFALTEANSAAVFQVCARLDGLPLAIELAAARVNVLPPESILARLERHGVAGSLQLLTHGPRDFPARHQTLRAAIGWSYDLLDGVERALFRTLGVFVGGFALEAAERVASGDGRGASGSTSTSAGSHDSPLTAPEAVLDVLGSLVAKSLVQQRTDGVGSTPRFAMLETIREYALERLEDAGEAERARGLHAEYFAELAEEGERQVGGPRQIEWLDRLDEEHPNVRAALGWSLLEAGGDRHLGSRLAGALWVFWFRRGYIGEGSRWLRHALAANPDAPAAARARLLTADGSLARLGGDFARAATVLEAGAELYRAVSDAEGLAWALSHLGLVAQWLGGLDRGVEQLEESLALRRQLGNPRDVARSLFNLAIAEDFRRGYVRADALYDEALALYRQIGDTWGLGRVHGYWAKVALNHGDVDRAAALCEQGEPLSRQVGDTWGVALVLAGRGSVAAARGDRRRAMALLKESLVMFRDVGSRDRMAECLQDLASLACSGGLAEQAARLSGAAESTQQSIGLALWPAVRARRDRDLAAARETLGDAAFAHAWSSGQAMTLEQALDAALALTEDAPEDARRPEPGPGGEPALSSATALGRATSSAGAPAPPTPADAGAPAGVAAAAFETAFPLTPREREVATLVARGMTNREIADALIIGQRTADTHVSNILGKLGFANRSQLAAWVVEQGLLAR